MRMLIESYRLKRAQLLHAADVGDDKLVRVLDREIASLITRILDMPASTSDDVYCKLKFLSELIRNDAGDRQSVLRAAAILSENLDRHFRQEDPSAKQTGSTDRNQRPLPRDNDDDVFLHQAMLDRMREAIVLVSNRLTVIFANQAFCIQHGCRPLECLGRNFAEFCGQDLFDEKISDALASCFAGQTSELFAEGDGTRGAIEFRPFSIGEGPVRAAMVVDDGFLARNHERDD
jgi:PAS domain-containing protein